MNHAIIVHGWKGKPESNWKPWLQKELVERGWEVDAPPMPDTDHPLAEAWVAQLAQTIGEPSPTTYLIGHSLGCIAILRYLEALQGDQKVGAVIMVAGFGKKFDGYQGQHDSFFDHDLKWERIRKHCNNFAAIYSDNDTHIKLDQMELFRTQLGAKGVVLHGMGHFGSVDGVFEVPVVLEELLNYSDMQA
jgi:predicted alpha/beta hydrolase family esterase